MKPIILRALPALLACSLVSMSGIAQSSTPETMARFGNVLDQKKIDGLGITAWSIEKNGKHTVLYTTDDGKAIFTGIVWDAKSLQNKSDPVLRELKRPAPVVADAARYRGLESLPPSAPAISGKWSGAVPESIKTVANLSGIKVGKGAVADTLYIMIDPRCGYSRLAYKNLQPWIAKGHSVKWIPLPALGEGNKGVELIAAMLQKPTKATLDAQMLDNKQLTASASEADLTEMSKSLAFFFAAFEQNSERQPGVPISFLLDQRTGQARMVGGVHEPLVITEIFGALN